MAADAVCRCQFLHIDDNSDEIAQTSLMEHGAFGLACRARGIDHVGEAVWIREIDRGGETISANGTGFSHKVIDEESLGGSGAEVALCLLGF